MNDVEQLFDARFLRAHVKTRALAIVGFNVWWVRKLFASQFAAPTQLWA